MSPSIGRVATAMVTPFDERGDLDLDAAVELANWLVENGSDGLVLAGTTGESPTLTESEELVLFRTVREAVSVPVVAGAGSNSTASAVEPARRGSTRSCRSPRTTTGRPRRGSRPTSVPWPPPPSCP